MKRETSISRAEISELSMVSLDKVHKAVQRGALDDGSLASVVCFVLENRWGRGISAVDELRGVNKMALSEFGRAGLIKNGSDLHYEPKEDWGA